VAPNQRGELLRGVSGRVRDPVPNSRHVVELCLCRFHDTIEGFTSVEFAQRAFYGWICAPAQELHSFKRQEPCYRSFDTSILGVQ
jgi:hypothetical protein